MRMRGIGLTDNSRHNHVGHPASGESLGFANLLHALADGASLNLKMGDDRRFMGLGVWTQAHARNSGEPSHVIEIGFEGIEVDEKSGRVDLLHRHAGQRRRSLQHEALFPSYRLGGRRS